MSESDIKINQNAKHKNLAWELIKHFRMSFFICGISHSWSNNLFSANAMREKYKSVKIKKIAHSDEIIY